MVGAGKIVRIGGFNLSTLSSSILGVRQGGFDTLIKPLFANGEQGFAYDPNDLSTLYQDAAGAIPVTAAGQPVGLMLDKSKGLTPESNLVLGDGKHEGSELYVTKTDGFGSVSDLSLNAVNPLSGSKDVRFKLTTVSSAGRLRPIMSVRLSETPVVGNFYQFSFKYKVLSGEAKILAYHSGLATVALNHRLTGEGVFTMLMPYLGTDVVTPTIYFGESLFDMQMDDFEYRRLIGNHAYQSVSASRPILQQTPVLAANLLPTYDFRTWGTTGTPSPITANSFTTSVAGGVRSDILKPNTGYVIELDIENTSTVSIYHGANASTTVASGTRRKVLIQATTDIGMAFYLRSSAAGTTTVYSIKVQEITGYRTDQNYLAFDGTDDFLQTNSIDFTATDKVSLFAGIRKLSDAGTALLAELSIDSITTIGSFGLFAPARDGATKFQFATRGASIGIAKADDPAYSAPFSAVLGGVGDFSTGLCRINVNGILAGASKGLITTDRYGNYPLYIGRRTGTSLPFNGHLYGLIGIGRLTSDSETITLEKAIAKNTGVVLNV